MLIALNANNSDIVCALLEGHKVKDSYRIATSPRKSSDEYGLLLLDFLDMSSCEVDDVNDVIIACVVPHVLDALKQASLKFLGIEPLVIGPGMRSGISIRLDDPKSFGADCLANCVGASRIYGSPVLVINFGTATTFNYVNEKGAISSGLISAGLSTQVAALRKTTAQLPSVALTRPSSIVATNTRQAIQAGMYYSFIGGIEHVVKRFAQAVKSDFKVIATGDQAELIARDTDCIDIFDPDLMFYGMAFIYDLNKD